MSPLDKPHRPIGFWLKEADRRIPERVNAVREANGVTRTLWQVLTILYELGGATKDRVFEAMRTFVDEHGWTHARSWH